MSSIFVYPSTDSLYDFYRPFLYPMAIAARGPDPQVVKVMTERMAVVSALPEEK